MSIVDESSETNMDVEYNMKLLDLQLESMQLGSIVIVHKQLTAHAIQKLQEACSTDTTWMVTGRKLHENASFLLDELEPKEYVKAFDSILSQDVQNRLISDLDRRERAKLFLDEIVEKGQPAVEIFICELDRLGRHHILNILSGTNTSGFNVDRIAYQIRNSIVKNYSVFLAELEPKIIGTFFVEKGLLDNALYEEICQLPSRRNRVIAFLKWLLHEERPDAYFAFQNAVKMFYSKKFVKLLETIDPLSTSGISSRAADQTNDVARTHVLLYLARFKITFSNALC